MAPTDSVVHDQTVPYHDKLVPSLSVSFSQALKEFSPQRVLIVSNSSGTSSEDPGFIEAESLERELGCPVLRHEYRKPSRGCADEIRNHFKRLHSSDPRLVLIGDRLLTDIILANDMEAYGIWTTRLWKQESLFLRALERTLLVVVKGWQAITKEAAGR